MTRRSRHLKIHSRALQAKGHRGRSELDAPGDNTEACGQSDECSKREEKGGSARGQGCLGPTSPVSPGTELRFCSKCSDKFCRVLNLVTHTNLFSYRCYCCWVNMDDKRARVKTETSPKAVATLQAVDGGLTREVAVTMEEICWIQGKS